MEDKQYLDEAGLGEVGKVISKFYASKDDIKDLEGLKDFVASHNEIKLHYITHEEYQKMEGEDKLPQLSDIHDPIAIVAIGSPVDEVVAWGDDPWNALWDIGLVPEKVIGGRGHQKYILLNMTPNRKIIIDKVDDMDFNATPLKDSDVRLQLAFGERDHCVYWRLLANDTPDSHWSYIVDPYAKQNVENAQRAIYNLAQEMQGKMDKVELPTKLSQLEQDENHLTVTNKEKEFWNDAYAQNFPLATQINQLAERIKTLESKVLK